MDCPYLAIFRPRRGVPHQHRVRGCPATALRGVAHLAPSGQVLLQAWVLVAGRRRLKHCTLAVTSLGRTIEYAAVRELVRGRDRLPRQRTIPAIPAPATKANSAPPNNPKVIFIGLLGRTGLKPG